MIRFVLAGAFAALAAAAAVACSSSTNGAVVNAPGDDAAPGKDADAPDVVTATDAGTDANVPSACEGACKTTSLVTDFGGKQRTLDRAQFGTEAGDGGTAFHVEAHLGGAPECPTETSPSPKYTLVVGSLPGSPGKHTDRDGVSSAFFDFEGDLGLPPLTKAVSVNATVVARDSASPPKWVALDVDAFFREGSVKGHVYATYCASLSE